MTTKLIEAYEVIVRGARDRAKQEREHAKRRTVLAGIMNTETERQTLLEQVAMHEMQAKHEDAFAEDFVARIKAYEKALNIT